MKVASEGPTEHGAVREVAALFLRLGSTAFGGPAAHIAIMRDEVVVRRRWLDDQGFLDLLGATNLIPGPNSTEMAIHLGFRRAGWPGLITAGVCFILPAMAIVLALAWAYVEFGTRPAAEWVLYGVKPVVIAVVLQALWTLGRPARQRATLAAIAVAVFVGYLAGFNEIALLFGGAAVALALRSTRRATGLGFAALLPLSAPSLPSLGGVAGASVSLTTLFLTFLKIGSVLYGSGYVILALLRNDFVNDLGWLTDEQLIDAVAIGQLTPGPVFTTATFIGYLVAGWDGAILATIAIFLPSFVFVAAIHPLVPRLRRSPTMGAFLDGANVAALGLMAAVTWQLARDAVVDVPTTLFAVCAAIALLRFRVNSAWLLVAAAAGGALYQGLMH